MFCKKVEKYGSPISEKELTKINEILKTPEEYLNKIVKVKGKIIEECPGGCWFILKEDGAKIYVDIMPYGFAIPQRRNRIAIVEGKIIQEKGKIKLIGKGVEIK
jgi:hypothetical protein